MKGVTMSWLADKHKEKIKEYELKTEIPALKMKVQGRVDAITEGRKAELSRFESAEARLIVAKLQEFRDTLETHNGHFFMAKIYSGNRCSFQVVASAAKVLLRQDEYLAIAENELTLILEGGDTYALLSEDSVVVVAEDARGEHRALTAYLDRKPDLGTQVQALADFLSNFDIELKSNDKIVSKFVVLYQKSIGDKDMGTAAKLTEILKPRDIKLRKD